MQLQLSISLLFLLITLVHCSVPLFKNDGSSNVASKTNTSVSHNQELNFSSLSFCYRDLCKDNSSYLGLYCSCEEECFQTGDCCLGVYSLEEEKQVRERDYFEDYQHSDFYYGITLKVIGRCPPDWEDEIERQRCHSSVPNASDPLMMFPMTSSATNNIYKNLACGYCNEGNDTSFHLEFKCRQVSQLPVTLDEGFQLYFYNRSCLPKPPKTALIIKQKFFKTNEAITNCSSSWQTDDLISWRCTHYLEPFTYKGRRYKNAFCAQCNGIDVEPKDAVCRNSFHPTEDYFDISFDANFSDGGEIPLGDNRTRCDAGSIYDPYQERCRVLLSGTLPSDNIPFSIGTAETTSMPKNYVDFKSIVNLPNCTILKYNKAEVELIESPINNQEEIIIKGRKDTYQTGEYNFNIETETIDVCAKETNSSFPQCLRHYCSNSNIFKEPPCSCDSQCFTKGECCVDALTDDEIGKFKESDYLKCVPMLSGFSTFAIGKCPIEYMNKEMRELCESSSADPFLKLLVHSNRTKIIYKNVYCAMCHGASDVHFLSIQINCRDLLNVRSESTALQMATDSNPNCTVFVANSNRFHLSICTSECPKDWQESSDAVKREINWKCERILARVTVKTEGREIQYRNTFCAQCNGFDLFSANVTISCSYSPSGFGGYPADDGPGAHSLSVLFTVGGTKKVSPKV